MRQTLSLRFATVAGCKADIASLVNSMARHKDAKQKRSKNEVNNSPNT
jgi:hypothetical protein